MRNDGENLPNSLCDPRAPTDCSGRFAATGRRVTQLRGTANPIIPLGNRLDTQLYTSNLEWATDAFAVSAITGFVNTRERSAIDLSDGRAFPTAAVPVTGAGRHRRRALRRSPAYGDYDQFSQEVRLIGSLLDGRVDIIAGLLYFDAKTADDQGLPGSTTGVTDKAAYLQADVNVTDRLKLTAGTRYTDETACPSFGSAPGTCLNTANLVGPTTARPIWSPRFAASYRAADDRRSSMPAPRAAIAPPAGTRNRGWSPTSCPSMPTVSGPMKAASRPMPSAAGCAPISLPSGSRRRDTQVPLVLGSDSVVQTIDGYRNRGVELELTAAPITGLTLRTSLAYQKDRYNVGAGLTPNALGVSSVAAQQALCRAQLANGRCRLPAQPTPPLPVPPASSRPMAMSRSRCGRPISASRSARPMIG